MNVYLDLDRTLFDTDRSGRAIWDALDALPQVDAHAEFARQREFYVYQNEGSTYYYDFAAHLESLSLDPADIEAYLLETATGDELLLPGAVEFVEQLRSAGIQPEILTYGHDFYQRLKAKLCPVLADIVIHTTLGPKQDFFYDKSASILVDDKPIGNQLPPQVAFIQVQLEAKKTIPEHAHWPVYTELSPVADEILRRVDR